MQTPQFVGLGVTATVMLTVDLPVDWLCALSVFCGAVATFASARAMKARR